MKLSSTLIDAEIQNTLTNQLKDRVIWDSTVPGLGARISPKGKVSFILMYRFHGQVRKLTMGRYGRVTLHQAREQAKIHGGEIMGGVDPALKKKEARAGVTMRELCRMYIEEHASRKRSARDDIQKVNKYIVPFMGSRKVASITYHDVSRLHKSIAAPIQANRCLSVLSMMFQFAKDKRLVDAAAVNPAYGVKKNPEKSRSRYIRDDEMPRIMQGIQNVADPLIRGALLVCLFTGVRQGSVMRLKWSDVNLEAGLLFERKAKTSKAGEIVTHNLAQAAIDVLSGLPRKANVNDVFLDGFSKDHQVKRMRKEWATIKKAAGIEEEPGDELWLHDLRRTVGSWLVKNNYSTNIAKSALNHKSLGAAQRYQHISDGDIVKRAMDDITQKMLDSGKPKPQAQESA